MKNIKNLTQKLIELILKISEKILPKKILKIEKKFLTTEIVLYIIFGIFTTIINIGFFSLLTSIFNLEENLSNTLSIILAVLFAYFTNKGLVFNSTALSLKEKLTEFSKFILGRAFTMIIELVGFHLFFNILGIQKFISKTVITILVIILNFFISKFFAFKNKL